jgi:hypothetical protein
MTKAKRRPAAVVPVAPAVAEGGADAGIQALNAKIAKMQAEIDALKKQQGQILAFIKQKLK